MEAKAMDSSQFKTASLVVRLGNAVVWIRSQRMQQKEITSSQSDVIRYLLHHQDRPVSARDLMKQLGLSPSTMAGILKRLENKSLINRRTDASDARRVIITLTEKGASLEEYLKETAARTEKILLEGMSQEEQDTFYHLLETALANAERVKKEGRMQKK